MNATPQANRPYYQTLDIFRLILAFFVCVKALGFPTGLGGYLQAFSTFAVPSFYIISGFLELQEGDDFEPRLLNAIKRTGITFLVLMLAYALCSVLLQPLMGASLLDGIKPFFSKNAVFEFIVFNNWPLLVGGNIWFLQGLLYGYIIIYLLHHFHLMKLEVVLLPLLLVLSYACGEFAVVLNIHPLGLTYLSSNFLTSALPYLLLGRFLHAQEKYLIKTRTFLFPLIAICGLVLFALEVYLLDFVQMLVTTSQFIGTTVTAIALCCLCFCVPTTRFFTGNVNPGNRIAKAVYYLHNPLGTVVRLVLLRTSLITFIELSGYVSILVFGIILIGAFFRENIPGMINAVKNLKYISLPTPGPAKPRVPLKERIERSKQWFAYRQEMAQDNAQSHQYEKEMRRQMREARKEQRKYMREEAARFRRYKTEQFLNRFRRR